MRALLRAPRSAALARSARALPPLAQRAARGWPRRGGQLGRCVRARDPSAGWRDHAGGCGVPRTMLHPAGGVVAPTLRCRRAAGAGAVLAKAGALSTAAQSRASSARALARARAMSCQERARAPPASASVTAHHAEDCARFLTARRQAGPASSESARVRRADRRTARGKPRAPPYAVGRAGALVRLPSGVRPAAVAGIAPSGFALWPLRSVWRSFCAAWATLPSKPSHARRRCCGCPQSSRQRRVRCRR